MCEGMSFFHAQVHVNHTRLLNTKRAEGHEPLDDVARALTTGRGQHPKFHMKLPYREGLRGEGTWEGQEGFVTHEGLLALADVADQACRCMMHSNLGWQQNDHIR